MASPYLTYNIMSEFKVASRYAKSLIGLAQEKGVLEEVHQDMRLFANTCQTSRDLHLMLKNPIVSRDVKLRVLHQLFSGKVNAMSMAFFDIVVKKHRESILESVAKECHLLYNQLKNIENALVITPMPLTDELRAMFIGAVKEMSGKEVDLSEKVDPDLIGGFVLRINDKQVDDSVKSRLQELKTLFSQNLYIKDF